MAQYLGLIDMLGLDMFFEIDPFSERAITETLEAFVSGNLPPDSYLSERFVILDLRARFNSHRFPIIFAAEVNDIVINAVKNLMNNGEPVKAADFIIRGSTGMGVSKGTKHNLENLKKLVPEFSVIEATDDGYEL